MSATDVAMLSTCCLLLCLVAVSRQLSITEFAVPKSVEAGQDAELQCHYDLEASDSEKDLFVKWWWTPLPDTKDKTQIYQRRVGRVGEQMQHNIEVRENDTIVLLKVNPANSGTYECEVTKIDGVRKQEELIVFTVGNGPQLNISTVEDGPDEDDDEDVLIECEAQDAFPMPDLVVTINGEDVNITETVVGPDDGGLYSVSANATVSKGEVEGAEIRCELFYFQYNVTHQPYIDTELYNPSGAGQSTTEAPEDETEPAATPESLQNSRDNGSILHSSRLLLAAVLLRNLASM